MQQNIKSIKNSKPMADTVAAVSVPTCFKAAEVAPSFGLKLLHAIDVVITSHNPWSPIANSRPGRPWAFVLGRYPKMGVPL